MTKTQAAPGLAPERDSNGEFVVVGGEVQTTDTSPEVRWVGNRRVALNARAQPVRQYEPNFLQAALGAMTALG